MEILIVDDEASTRDALREVLSELGYKPIFEAKNGEEALKIIDAEKQRIRMVIADWEMPQMDGITLSDRLAEIEGLDLIPFLIITSDLPAARLNEIKEHHKRIDHALFKPFRANILNEAIKQAHAVRASKRDEVLWIGSTPPAAALSVALTGKKEDILFKKVTTDLESKNFSVVVLDAERAGKDAGAIATLKKSRLGSSAIWVALSRDPELIFPFRMMCHLFVDPGSLLGVDAWLKFLGDLHGRIRNSWEVELLSIEAKGLIQQKKAAAARKIIEKLLLLDPINAESHAWLADILIQEGDSETAVVHELQALKLNPCLPKPYIKLFEILPRSNIAKIREISAAAQLYCPQNLDVLSAAVPALRASGHAEAAEELSERIQKLTEDKK